MTNEKKVKATCKKLEMVSKDINSRFFERENVVEGFLNCLIAETHMLLVGAPGAAKTAIFEYGSRFFTQDNEFVSIECNKFMALEDLFGPISSKKLLEADEYIRNCVGRVPDGQIVFLDEVFKANVSGLNALLKVMSDRLFMNGTQTPVPLRVLIGASNEIPEGEEAIVLRALWDRFTMRYILPDSIQEEGNFLKMMQATIGETPDMLINRRKAHLPNRGFNGNVIPLSEIDEVQNFLFDPNNTEWVKERGKAIDLIHQIRKLFREKQIWVSDRRYKSLINVMVANAWRNDRGICEDDLLAIVPALWETPDQMKSIQGLIVNMVSPFDQEANLRLDEAIEVYNVAMAAKPEDGATAGSDAVFKFKLIIGKLETLKTQCVSSGKSTSNIESHLLKVADMNKEVLKKCLNLTM